MNFSLKKLYAYSISLITLIMLITALWALASAVIDFIYPIEYSPKDITVGEDLEPLIREEPIKSEYVKQESIKRIFENLLKIAIILPFYSFHWKLAKNTEKH